MWLKSLGVSSLLTKTRGTTTTVAAATALIVAASGSAWFLYQRYRSSRGGKLDEIFEEILARRSIKEEVEEEEEKTDVDSDGDTAIKRIDRTMFQRVLTKAIRPLMRSLLPAVLQGLRLLSYLSSCLTLTSTSRGGTYSKHIRGDATSPSRAFTSGSNLLL